MFQALPVLAALLSASPILQSRPLDRPAVAPTPAEQVPPAPVIVPFEADPVMRMTVPIMLNGVPQRFLVDSGSERTAISAELASRLGMVPTGSLVVTGLSGKSLVPTVVVPRLGFAQAQRLNVEALLFSRYAIGADGFLGADMLAHQLVDLDFANNRMSLRRAPSIVRPPTADQSVLLKMRMRKGRLVFTQAWAANVKVRVVVDTGTSITIGNRALRDRLASRRRLGKTIPVTLIAVTGEPVRAELGVAREVVIGGATFRNIPIAFATVEPFVQLDLVEEPAMLLGMDALRAFARVTLDFRNKSVAFTMRSDFGTTYLNISGVTW